MNYHALTEADTLATKKQNMVKKDKSTPAAALLPVDPIMPVAMVMLSVVLGYGTDSEYVDAPFFVPHFFFDCSIGSSSASAELPVHALIDDGYNAVLIDPVCVDCLGLEPHKLPKPKEVMMAVGQGKKEVFSFDEWVPLTVISFNQA